MGLDLWFRQDVARILAATWQTMRATSEGTRLGPGAASNDGAARAYQQGFEDALRAVGVAFGLAEGTSGTNRTAEIPPSGYATGPAELGRTSHPRPGVEVSPGPVKWVLRAAGGEVMRGPTRSGRALRGFGPSGSAGPPEREGNPDPDSAGESQTAPHE